MTLQTRLDGINTRIDQETQRWQLLQQEQQRINQAILQCREALLRLDGARTTLLELQQEAKDPPEMNGRGRVLEQDPDLLTEARNG